MAFLGVRTAELFWIGSFWLNFLSLLHLCAIPTEAVMISSQTKEQEVFIGHYSKLCDTITDIDSLLPHFVQENIIPVGDLEDTSSLTRLGKVKKLLSHISGPLKANNAAGFYTLLSIMEEHGTQATRELASTMRSLVTTDLSKHSMAEGKYTTDFLCDSWLIYTEYICRHMRWQLSYYNYLYVCTAHE